MLRHLIRIGSDAEMGADGKRLVAVEGIGVGGAKEAEARSARHRDRGTAAEGGPEGVGHRPDPGVRSCEETSERVEQKMLGLPAHGRRDLGQVGAPNVRAR